MAVVTDDGVAHVAAALEALRWLSVSDVACTRPPPRGVTGVQMLVLAAILEG